MRVEVRVGVDSTLLTLTLINNVIINTLANMILTLVYMNTISKHEHQ